MRKLSDADNLTIVNLYTTHKLTCTEISKRYNVDKGTICNVLARFGIERDKSRGKIRKYLLNQNYFDEIDSEHKAYWLGWLYADGYNQQTTGSIKLGVQERDKEILYKFQEDLSSNKPPYLKAESNPKRQNSYHLVLNSQHMSNQLANLGCWQRKSLNLNFPNRNQVPPELIQHFIRGLWDGDGCYNGYTNKNNRFNISCIFSGTKNVCDGLLEIISRTLNIKVHIYYDKKSNNSVTHRLQISGNRGSIKLINYLYERATVWLDRKYNKCNELKNELMLRNLL